MSLLILSLILRINNISQTLLRLGATKHAMKRRQKYVGKGERLLGGKVFKSLTFTAGNVENDFYSYLSFSFLSKQVFK